jgi:hypothetical protein
VLSWETLLSLLCLRWDFAWLTPMMAKGAKDYLEEEDLPTLPPWDRSRELGGSLIDAKKKQSVRDVAHPLLD